MPDKAIPPTSSNTRVRLLGVLWLVMYFGARVLLKQEAVSTGLRIGIALAPVPVFGAFLWQVIRSIRNADEFERRIHLEALAVAFPLTLLLLTTLALMQRAVDLSVEDWSYAHVWIYLPIFYLGGLTLARKRYS